MTSYGQCRFCNEGELVMVGKKQLGNTTYTLVKCNKCNHETAKRQE
ncbi:MAG: hypothetical protein KJ601_00320 [Nanoarchaeota archaeon]|nr:hypothetical protein [Nanoarchaeota archaeon]